MINRQSMTFISILAFIFYQLVNFIYFPIDLIFPDEQRFLAEAITLANTGEFWIGDNRAWEMPLTAIVYAFFYKVFNNIEYSIISIRLFQSLLLIFQALLVYKISLESKKLHFYLFVLYYFIHFLYTIKLYC